MEIIKADGTREVFKKEKLYGSLVRAGASETLADSIVAHISAELHDGDTTKEIYIHAHEILKREAEAPVAARYSLRNAILELGPTGFAFEKLLERLYQARGYTAETGVLLKGRCIEHEIDVLAEKENERILVEAKFHNSKGFKTDVKVTLYMRARFDDIEAGDPTFAGTCKCYVITNTKFTTNAIQYAECAGIQLIGWRYPEVGHLEDLIDEAGLHPVTCLSTLSKRNKETLMADDVVLCSALMDNPEKLEHLGLSGGQIKEVMEEAQYLCIPKK